MYHLVHFKNRYILIRDTDYRCSIFSFNFPIWHETGYLTWGGTDYIGKPIQEILQSTHTLMTSFSEIPTLEYIQTYYPELLI